MAIFHVSLGKRFWGSQCRLLLCGFFMHALNVFFSELLIMFERPILLSWSKENKKEVFSKLNKWEGHWNYLFCWVWCCHLIPRSVMKARRKLSTGSLTLAHILISLSSNSHCGIYFKNLGSEPCIHHLVWVSRGWLQWKLCWWWHLKKNP